MDGVPDLRDQMSFQDFEKSLKILIMEKMKDRRERLGLNLAQNA